MMSNDSINTIKVVLTNLGALTITVANIQTALSTTLKRGIAQSINTTFM